MRGNRPTPTRIRRTGGSIPARAGEPSAMMEQGAARRVYPRACGGTPCIVVQNAPGHGLSPRVRGNRPGRFGRSHTAGSIPARAGEPAALQGKGGQKGVYPRACGGTRSGPSLQVTSSGLSPRVRGNPPLLWRPCARYGSIPARAGEPGTPGWPTPPTPVYPRACGGTSTTTGAASTVAGLSPRVRGNRRRVGARARR